MDEIASEFLGWAEDGARTEEERFGIVLFSEYVYRKFCWNAGLPAPDFTEERRKREARRFNPAYVEEVPRWKLEFIAGKLGGLRELRMGNSHDDRPLRDLSVLRFVPGLEELGLDSIGREDLEGLRYVPGLRKLSIWGLELEDFGEIAVCRGLRELSAYCQHPCPTLAGLEGLPVLERLAWNGAPHALATVGSLPALRRLTTLMDLHFSRNTRVLRDLHELPEMPLLEELRGVWFCRLAGLERFPRLHFLTAGLFAKDTGELAGMERLTHLRLAAPRLELLDAAAGLPRLVQLALYSERPQDWGVMMECETLREVFHFIDYETEADLGMLRLVLPDAGDMFAAAEPRVLAPLRLVTGGSHEEKGMCKVGPDAAFPEGPDGWDGNPGMRETEKRWVCEKMREALRGAGFLKLQGLRLAVGKNGSFHFFTSTHVPLGHRMASFTLLGTEAIAKAPEIVECVRRVLAGLRHRWQVYVHMDAEPDADTWDEPWRNRSKEDMARVEEEDERQMEFDRKRKRILLDDELRLRMMRELGQDVSTFRPSPRPATPHDPHYAPEPEERKKPDDGGPGGTAECDPDNEAPEESWLPKPEITDPNSRWRELFCAFEFDEEAVYMHVKNHGLETIRYLFDFGEDGE